MSEKKTIDNGGAAFPRQAYINRDEGIFDHNQEGLTLRDYFAAKIAPEVLSSLYAAKDSPISAAEAPQFVAETAYDIADAMIAARKR